MKANKTQILDHLCFTELVYGRINKKLKSDLSKSEIETLLSNCIRETEETCIQKTGKNFYVLHAEKNLRITIHSKTFRVITVDLLSHPASQNIACSSPSN